jgi:hypothetical protein
MKVRAYEMPDGTVRIVVPSTTTNPQVAGETDDQFIARKAAKAEEKDPTLKTALRHVDVDKTVADTLDRSKRYAYRFNALKTSVVVDPLVPVPVDAVKVARDARIDAMVGFTAAQKAALKTLF